MELSTIPPPPPHTHTLSSFANRALGAHSLQRLCGAHGAKLWWFSHSVDDFSVVFSLVWLLLCVVRLRVRVRVQVVVGFAGKLVGYLQAGDLYPGVELRFMDCLPLQQSLRRTDIVTLLLQIADIVRGTPPSDVASASGCLSPPSLCLFSLPALPAPPVTNVSVSHGVSLRLLGVADARTYYTFSWVVWVVFVVAGGRPREGIWPHLRELHGGGPGRV